jgi:outer membrane murein-binding lipoprotein Lpp
MLAEADISAVPAELIKHLLTLGLAFAGVWFANKRASRGTKESPVAIEQPLNVRKHDEMVRKSEVDKVESQLKKLGDRVESLADQINAQFAAMTRAGQDRAAAISQNIDEEIGTLSIKLGELAEALHEKINAARLDNARHGADIDHLKAGEYRHNTEMARIQEHIADLLSRPTPCPIPNPKRS